MARRHRNRHRTGTESHVRKEICNFLDEHGWWWHYVADSRYAKGHVGFPDLTCVKLDHLMFIECKRKGGQLGPGQNDWLAKLQVAGAISLIISPDNLDLFKQEVGKL